MKKLTSKQRQKLSDYQENLDVMRNKLEINIDDFNNKLQEIWEEIIQPNLTTYNETVQEAQTFITEIRDAMQNYYDNKSEKWQEDECGEAYQGWIDEWATDLEEIELEKPDELEQPEFQATDQITLLS